MTFRTYDATIGRFLQIDPLAEMTPNWTPFHFTHNTPINGTDPSGLSCAGCPNGEGGWGTHPPLINGDPAYIGASANTDPPVNGGDLPTATVRATRLPKSTNYETVTTTEDGYREQTVKSKLDDYYWNSLIFTPGGEMIGRQFDGSFGYGKTGMIGLEAVEDPFTMAAPSILKSFMKAIFAQAGSNVAKSTAFNLTPKGEPTMTIFRGMSGNETKGLSIYFTNNSAVAATYAKNGKDVYQYTISKWVLQRLEMAGRVNMKNGLHGTTGQMNTEYQFIGSDLINTMLSIGKPLTP